MLKSVPQDLKIAIQSQLTEYNNEELTLLDFNFSTGGCINNTGILKTSNGSYFIKWNTKSRYPNLFEKEKRGLLKLSSASHSLKIPRVMSSGETDSHIFLILECICAGVQRKDYWKSLGLGLAQLHQNESISYGLNEDNYIGSLVQTNKESGDWIDFFMNQRLFPNFKISYDKGYFNESHKESLENIDRRLPDMCPRNIKPSLLHGDLWSGNLMVEENGYPALIDPAIYFGFREIELAFTELFGRFGNEFYESYQDFWPMEKGYQDRIDIWNLYPLLVHVNLFGGSYVNSVVQILNKFK